MRSKALLLFIPLLFTAGCHPPVETAENHVVHSGDSARLRNGDAPKVLLAVAQEDAHPLASAVNEHRQADIDNFVFDGKAFAVDAGTPVRIASESFNERRVEIKNGPHRGRTGWVPFEWLKP